MEEIHADSTLKSAKALQSDGGLTTVEYAPLDIASNTSIEEFQKLIKTKHPDGIDILVNNAGVALDGFNSNIVKNTLACNYYGTLKVTEMLLPHIGEGGRLVNVSSLVGKLNKYSPAIQKRFREAQSVSDITALMEEYQKEVDAGTQEQSGWPSTAYAVSKAGLTAVSKLIGKQVQEGTYPDASKGVLVNCCCPGYVSTSMSKFRGRKTPDQGAMTPIKLAIDDVSDVGGEFWEHEEISQW